MAESQENLPVQTSIDLQREMAGGVFADFTSVWHTPSTFVLDFVALMHPAQPVTNEAGIVDHQKVDGAVVSRVRIPPEQIFPLIQALQRQSDQWLKESGRSEPPSAWMPEVHEP